MSFVAMADTAVTEGLAALMRRLDGQDALAVRQALVEEGWIGLLAPEGAGGMDLTLADALGCAKICGASALPVPFAALAALGRVLGQYGAEQPLTARHFAGEILVLPAFAGVPGVADGDDADAVLSAGGGRLVLYDLTAAEGPGLAGRRALIDGGASHVLEAGPEDGVVLLDGEDAVRAGAWLRDAARLLSAAELSGLAEEAFRRTIDYLNTREQFGASLGSFQALQHRAAAVHVRLEALGAFIAEANRAMGSARQGFAAAAALAEAIDAVQLACKEAIQMHGAIGFAEEGGLGRFLRRSMGIAARWGGRASLLREAGERLETV